MRLRVEQSVSAKRRLKTLTVLRTLLTEILAEPKTNAKTKAVPVLN
jgi:hypothetical protein